MDGYQAMEVILADLRFTRAPERDEVFQVGDIVEVFCDHENKEGARVRDWLKGVVVQSDPKMVAVQFQEDVYLTDGWKIPDHVLWSPQKSSNIRHFRSQRKRRRRQTPKVLNES
ncbi:MAG: hypothetical protein ACE5GO_05465 [Anaerolineales bacterium]